MPGINDNASYHKRAWEQMKWIRFFEEELMRRYEPPHLTRCPIHYCIGQEMAPAYVGEVKAPGDWLFTHHRNHGYWLSWVGCNELLLAELMGKQSGVNNGRVGSQEISAPFANFYSGAILSTMIAIATGTALSYKLEGDSTEVVFCAFGDGAADEGIFWEAMNFIALKKLPMVLICENNNYATFSPQGKRQAVSISNRVRAFGIKTLATTGVVPGSFGILVKQAVDNIRQAREPVFIEHHTYRHCGHVGAHDDDVNEYRSEEERKAWKDKDDLKLLEIGLERLGVIDCDETGYLDKEYLDRFSAAWDSAASAESAKPIDYSTETTSKRSLIDLPFEEQYTPEQWREAFLNPY